MCPPVEKCENCSYFKPREDERGECRVNPPDVRGIWPVINANDWCGSWALKVEKEEEKDDL